MELLEMIHRSNHNKGYILCGVLVVLSITIISLSAVSSLAQESIRSLKAYALFLGEETSWNQKRHDMLTTLNKDLEELSQCQHVTQNQLGLANHFSYHKALLACPVKLNGKQRDILITDSSGAVNWTSLGQQPSSCLKYYKSCCREIPGTTSELSYIDRSFCPEKPLVAHIQAEQKQLTIIARGNVDLRSGLKIMGEGLISIIAAGNIVYRSDRLWYDTKVSVILRSELGEVISEPGPASEQNALSRNIHAYPARLAVHGWNQNTIARTSVFGTSTGPR
jgi:hypothetical protein